MHAAKPGETEAIDPDRLMLAAIAGETIQNVPQDRHATAIAHLLMGNTNTAVSILEGAAANDATAWCDLAAARYTLAVRDNDPTRLPHALAAADAALRLNPKLAEAVFNRALIVERLGLRDAGE